MGSTQARASALRDATQDVRPVAVAVLDRELRLVEVNDQMPVLTGMPVDALVGHRAMDVFAPVWDRLESACRQVLDSGTHGGPLTVTWQQEDARQQPATWLISMRAMHDGDGDGIVLAAADDSATKQLREQLRQAQSMEALGRLARGIAHDLNNMLTAIGGYTDLARSELEAGDPVCADLQEVLKAVDRARVLSRRILTFSNSTRDRPQVQAVDDVTRDTERMLRHLLGENVEVQTRLRSRGAVRLHAGELEQMLVNLALNARAAMPDGGLLTLETEDVSLSAPLAGGVTGAPAGEYVRIGVADNGGGMDAGTREQVFELFFTTKPSHEGTGLGLPNVLASIQRASGDVTITSDPGSGSRFDVYLPQVPRPDPEGGGEEPAPRGTEALLVVDDEELVRSATVRMLEALGYRVQAVGSAPEALELCRQPDTRPDLLITDIVMPLMTGPELAGRCRELAPGLRVLFASGVSSAAGADPVLLKPFGQRAAGLRVREVLDS